MKTIYLLTILSIIYFNSYSQGLHYVAEINFETNSHLIEIDTSQTNNIWQIGIPNKLILDSSYSAPYSIITDTINNYPINNFSSFQVKILPPPGSCWGCGNFYFFHKYDFEQNKDGGFIEVQYDNDTNWTNIIFDTEPIYSYGYPFYSNTDTIFGNIPAFTGSSNGWIFTQVNICWQIGVKWFFHDSLTIRFSIKSDSVNTNQEGWLIDNIYLELYDCTGNVTSNSLNTNFSKILPNPVTNISTLEFANDSKSLTMIYIFDISGKIINHIDTYENKVFLDTVDYDDGIYHYQILQNKNIIGFGNFVTK